MKSIKYMIGRMRDMTSGKLYICPTPIGNMEDITVRTLRILEEVDLVAAEDTRHSGMLLKHYEIDKPFTSYHEHNKAQKGPELIEKLKAGIDIALVSDAGMPGISDPGSDLVSLCIEEDIDFIVLPGATASLVALVSSGLGTDKFTFEGFLSSKKSERIKELENIKFKEETLILYESPHRLLDSLEDMEAVLGDRRMSVSRELTKMYEETIRGSIGEVREHFLENRPRGEFVIILEGSSEKIDPYENISIVDHLKSLVDEGYSKKDAIKKVSSDRNLPRNLVYKESLDI